jgi:hypothetical protein
MGIIYKTKTFSEIYSSASEFVNDAKTTFSMLDNISDENKTVLYYLLFGRYGNSPISNWDETQFKTKLFSIMFQYGPTWEKRLDVQEALRGLTLDQLIDDGAVHELFEHSGSQNTTKTGSGTNTRTGSESGTNTGTSTLTRTGTVGVQESGSSSTDHDATVETDNTVTDIKNHAYNPSTSPATNAFAPLTYIDEQHAEQNILDGQAVTDETTSTTSSGSSTTTNNLTDQTTNNLANSKSTNISDTSSTSDDIDAEDESTNETTRTLTQGTLKAYEKLINLLDTDVTGEFISKFKVCFKQFVGYEHPFLYEEAD